MNDEENPNDIAKEFYEKSDRRTYDLQILLDKLEKCHENLGNDLRLYRKFLRGKPLFELMRRGSAMGLRSGAEDLGPFPTEREIISLKERIVVLRKISEILTKLSEPSEEKEKALKILKEEIAAFEELAPDA